MAVATRSLGLLLPPSEGKAAGGDGPKWSSDLGRFRELQGRRDDLVRALATVEGGDEKLLGVGGRHLDEARSANVALTAKPSLPAWRRYTGVVWAALDTSSLPVGVRHRAMSSVVVVSGLLGLAALDDPTPEYRLKMGASLAPFGRLSTWWRPTIGDALTAWAGRRFIVDLLPNEHRAACSAAHLRGVSVSFVERGGTGSGHVSGHAAKNAKGRLARHLLISGGHPSDALESWVDARFDLVVTPIGR
jgi:cytoplasmic iron level regulating protein YaaA (DUF328/UPF0246 family)